MSNIADTNVEFIENSIDIGIKISEARDQGQSKHVNDFSGPYGNDLTNIYFVGQGLCLDVKDERRFRISRRNYIKLGQGNLRLF
jgi:hypothetical protein